MRGRASGSQPHGVIARSRSPGSARPGQEADTPMIAKRRHRSRRRARSSRQPRLTDGFAYRDWLISPDERARWSSVRLADHSSPVEFHGYLGKRRIVSFGWRTTMARALREARRSALPAAVRAAAAASRVAPGGGPCSRSSSPNTRRSRHRRHRDKKMLTMSSRSRSVACILRSRRQGGHRWESAARAVWRRARPICCAARRGGKAAQRPPVDRLRYR